MRINKYIAIYGGYSRRKADALVTEGNIEVNGKRAVLGQEIDPSKDEVVVSGTKIVQEDQKRVYYALNKSLEVISSASDDLGRATVTGLVPQEPRVYPIGRLDYDTKGLLLLTNDGDLAYKLTHPKYHIPKTYEVIVSGRVPETILNNLRAGVILDDGMTAPAEASIVEEVNNTSVLNLTIYEGKKRQIRRMCEALGLKLLGLKRISIGNIRLGKLKEGMYRKLTQKELDGLKNFHA